MSNNIGTVDRILRILGGVQVAHADIRLRNRLQQPDLAEIVRAYFERQRERRGARPLPDDEATAVRSPASPGSPDGSNATRLRPTCSSASGTAAWERRSLRRPPSTSSRYWS